MDVRVMATPLMEPNLSGLTELLINKKMEEYPTANSPLVVNSTKDRAAHNSQVLWIGYGT